MCCLKLLIDKLDKKTINKWFQSGMQSFSMRFCPSKVFGQGSKYGLAGKSVCKCSCITCQYRLISDAEGRTDAGLILLETQNVPQHSSPHTQS